ncbi:hypothetical protein HD806DRAFT_528387 [Xylariaceae sp. AK1471]|nr:hypothetical protein HD806DRAFT_528387 [Xylariaceae sp. AK1471]
MRHVIVFEIKGIFVLGPPRHVHHEHGPPLQRLGDEVPIRDGAHRVPQQAAREAQLRRHHVPVDAEGVAGQRAAAQGRPVHAPRDLAQALEVRREGQRVREHPVALVYGLRALQVRVLGHDVGDLALGAVRADGQEFGEVGFELGELVAQLHAHVAGYLFVAVAACVQLASYVFAD